MPLADAIEAAPHVYRVLLENDRVRVLEVRIAPGASSAMHGHPDYLVYNLEIGDMAFTSADGEKHRMSLKAGDTIWRDAEAHSAENVGTNDIVAVMVELK